MPKFIVNRPLRFGKKIFPKSPLIQEIPEEHCEGWFFDEMKKSGGLSPVADDKPKAAAPKAADSEEEKQAPVAPKPAPQPQKR